MITGKYDGVAWRIDINNNLIIGRKFDKQYMDYREVRKKEDYPWYKYRNDLKRVIFEGVVFVYGSADFMFCGCSASEIDFAGLDVSEVTSMKAMFYGATFENYKNMDLLQTYNVEDMSHMFRKAKLYNINLSYFDTSACSNMKFMFSEVKSKFLDISSFDMSGVINVSNMFKGISCDSIDFGDFAIQDGTISDYMFDGADIGYVVSKNRDFLRKVKALGIKCYTSSRVLRDVVQSGLCDGVSYRLEKNGTLHIGRVNEMQTFSNTSFRFAKDYAWYAYRDSIKKVVFEGTVFGQGDMGGMFSDCNAAVIDLKGFDTSKITDMSSMFANSRFEKLDLRGFDTRNVRNMQSMFYRCRASEIDVSGFDTSNVLDMGHMFYECKNLKRLDLSGFNVANVSRTDHMFYGCDFDFLNISSFNLINLVGENNMLDNASVTNLETVPTVIESYNRGDEEKSDDPDIAMSSFNRWNVYDDVSWKITSDGELLLGSESEDQIFAYQDFRFAEDYPWYGRRGDIKSIRFIGKVYGQGNMQDMFMKQQAESIDLALFNTSKVVNMSYMFSDSCFKELDLRGFDTGRVENMQSMFAGVKAQRINVSEFNTVNVVNMDWMFSNIDVPELDVSSFSVKSLADASYMFTRSKIGELKMFLFDEDVFDQEGTMFVKAEIDSIVRKEEEVVFEPEPEVREMPDFGNYDGVDWAITEDNVLAIGNPDEVQEFYYSAYRSAKNYPWYKFRDRIEAIVFIGPVLGNGSMQGMFAESFADPIVLDGFNTEQVTDMSYMFYNTIVEELDLRGFNTRKVTNMAHMFGNTEADIINLSSFEVPRVVNMEGMFERCRLDVLDLSSFRNKQIVNVRDMFLSARIGYLDMRRFNMKLTEHVDYMLYRSKIDESDMEKLPAKRENISKLELRQSAARFKRQGGTFNGDMTGLPSVDE